MLPVIDRHVLKQITTPLGAAMAIGLLMLLAERMEQEAAGFGFRNFWVSIIKKSLVEIEKKKYKAWRSKYGS